MRELDASFVFMAAAWLAMEFGPSLNSSSPRMLRAAYAFLTLALVLRAPKRTKIEKSAAACWSDPHEHGDLDPCAHCGHMTDSVCMTCKKGAPNRDVCPCCLEMHWNVVHVAGGLLQ
jgi:hypothetical protein